MKMHVRQIHCLELSIKGAVPCSAGFIFFNQSFEKAHKEQEYTANRNSMHTRKQISTHTVSRAARQQKQITESDTEIRDLRQDGIISQSQSPWSSMKPRRVPLIGHTLHI